MYFSETAASKSERLLSILNRSFSAREKDRAIVLRVVSFWGWGCWAQNVRLRSIAGLPVPIHLVVGHFDAICWILINVEGWIGGGV